MEPAIETWGRLNYPRLMENPKLIEALYVRKILNRPTLVAQTMAFPLAKVANLEPDKMVSLVVTKVDMRVTERLVCKVCNRSPKNCKDASHGGERIPFYVVNMQAGDESGMEKFQRIGTDKDMVDSIEHGEQFVVTGSLKVDAKWGREFDVRSFAALSNVQLEAWNTVEDYYSIHGGEGGVAEEEFDKLLVAKQEVLAPILERVYISRMNGRVRF